MNKRSLMIVNFAAMAAMLVAVVNLVTIKEIWVLAAAIGSNGRPHDIFCKRKAQDAKGQLKLCIYFKFELL